MLIEVFAHPQCHVCHRLLKDLRSLHERYPSVELKIIDVERNPYEAQQRNILGVPATFIDGSLAFVGAPPTGELESYLQGRKAQLPEETKNVEKVAELAVEALGSISTTAIRFYLYGDYESLFQNRSLSARLMRIRDWKAIDEKALRDMLVARGGSLLEMKKTMFLEKISSEFVREIYWLYDEYPSRDEIELLYPTNVFAHWLMTKASMGGRIGQNIRKLSDRSLMQRVIAARQFTLNNYEGLCEKVAGQQESINN